MCFFRAWIMDLNYHLLAAKDKNSVLTALQNATCDK
jgi:hypothetical protein